MVCRRFHEARVKWGDSPFGDASALRLFTKMEDLHLNGKLLGEVTSMKNMTVDDIRESAEVQDGKPFEDFCCIIEAADENELKLRVPSIDITKLRDYHKQYKAAMAKEKAIQQKLLQQQKQLQEQKKQLQQEQPQSAAECSDRPSSNSESDQESSEEEDTLTKAVDEVKQADIAAMQAAVATADACNSMMEVEVAIDFRQPLVREVSSNSVVLDEKAGPSPLPSDNEEKKKKRKQENQFYWTEVRVMRCDEFNALRALFQQGSRISLAPFARLTQPTYPCTLEFDTFDGERRLIHQVQAIKDKEPEAAATKDQLQPLGSAAAAAAATARKPRKPRKKPNSGNPARTALAGNKRPRSKSKEPANQGATSDKPKPRPRNKKGKAAAVAPLPLPHSPLRIPLMIKRSASAGAH